MRAVQLGLHTPRRQAAATAAGFVLITILRCWRLFISMGQVQTAYLALPGYIA
jgi:hypothetical protein